MLAPGYFLVPQSLPAIHMSFILRLQSIFGGFSGTPTVNVLCAWDVQEVLDCHYVRNERVLASMGLTHEILHNKGTR